MVALGQIALLILNELSSHINHLRTTLEIMADQILDQVRKAAEGQIVREYCEVSEITW